MTPRMQSDSDARNRALPALPALSAISPHETWPLPSDREWGEIESEVWSTQSAESEYDFGNRATTTSIHGVIMLMIGLAALVGLPLSMWVASALPL